MDEEEKVGCADCPSCGDTLIGFTVREALEHLFKCDKSPGYVVLGVKPRMADEMYEQITGRSKPALRQEARVKGYWQNKV